MVGPLSGLARPARRLSILVDVQDQATAQLAAFNGVANKAGASAQGAAAGANQMKAALAGAAVAAGGAIIAMNRMVRVGAELDRTFARIQEAASATEEEIGAIRERTQEIGATMPVTMNEVTGAFEQMTYAGFSAEEALAAAESTTQLAIAGGLDMADAADTMTSTLNAFNLEAEQAQQVSSALASTFSNSAIEIGEIGSALQYSAAQMSTLGVDAAEATAAIGALADQGMRGTMAGTSLNQAMGNLLSTSDKVQGALSNAGLAMEDFTNAEGELKPITEVLGEIDQAMEDVDATQAEMSRWAKDVFGRRGARALLPLIDNIDELENKIRDSAMASLKDFMDTAEEAQQMRMQLAMDIENPQRLERLQQRYEEMSDGEFMDWAESQDQFDAQQFEEPFEVIEQLRTEFEEGVVDEEAMQQQLQTAFGMEEQPAARLTEEITSTENSLDDLREMFDEATASAELSAAQMDTVGGKLTYLQGTMQSVMYTMYEGFRPALQTILDMMISFADAVSAHPAILKAFGAAMFAATVAVTGHLAKVATLAALQTQLAGSVIASTGATWSYVTSAYAAVTANGIRQATINGVNKAIRTLTASMAASRSATVQQMRANLVSAGSYSTLTGAVKGFTKALKAKMVAMYAANPLMWKIAIVITALIALYVAYKNNILGARDAINWMVEATMGMIDAVMDAVQWFSELNAVGKLVIAGLLAFVSPAAAAAIAIYAIVDATLDLLHHFGLISEESTSVIGALKNLAGWLKNVGSGVAAEFVEFASRAGTALEDFGQFLYEFAAAGGDIFEGVTLAIQALAVALFDPVEAFDMLSDAMGEFGSAAGRVGPIIDGLVGFITNLAGGFHDLSAVAKAAGIAILAFTGPIGWTGIALLTLAGIISEVIKYLGGWGAATDAAGNAIDWLGGKVNGFIEFCGDIVDEVGNMIGAIGKAPAAMAKMGEAIWSVVTGFVGLFTPVIGGIMNLVNFAMNNKEVLAAMLFPALIPLYGIYRLVTYLADKVTLDAITDGFVAWYELIDGVLEDLEEVWDIVTDLDFGIFDLDIGVDFPSPGDIKDWLENLWQDIKNWWNDIKGTLTVDTEAEGPGGDELEERRTPDGESDTDDADNDAGRTAPDRGYGDGRVPQDNPFSAMLSPAAGMLENAATYMADAGTVGATTAAAERARQPSQPNIQLMNQQPEPASASASANAHGGGGTQLVDNRTLELHEDPSVSVTNQGGGMAEEEVRRAIDGAMGQARQGALRDFYDWLTLGGTGGLTEQGSGSEPPSSGSSDDDTSVPSGEEGEGEDGNGGEDGGEEGGEDGGEDGGETGGEDGGDDGGDDGSDGGGETIDEDPVFM